MIAIADALGRCLNCYTRWRARRCADLLFFDHGLVGARRIAQHQQRIAWYDRNERKTYYWQHVIENLEEISDT